MEGIRIISKNIVQPEKIHGEPIQRIELTSWDIKSLLLGPIQKGLFFPKPTPLQEQELLANDVVEHLKKTFARALEFFYPLCGRLGIVLNDDDTSSFFIDCNNKGAYFIHAVVDHTMIKDLLEPVYTPSIVESFFPMNGTINIEGDSNPLLAVQVNELIDGFFIGCTMNHLVVDNSSFWHFINSWSEISRGFDKMTNLPALSRWFPSEIKAPLRIPSSACLVPKDELNLPPFEERIFHFHREKIEKLKARANLEMNTTNTSSAQALFAHLWQSMTRSQKIDLDLEVLYVLVVGARPKLQSFIQENYFGNAVFSVPLSIKAAYLLIDQGLGNIASRIHQVISSQTGDELISDVIKWTKNPKLNIMGLFANVVLFSSSPRFNVYGNDFGWGRPVGVRSGSANKGDGKITFFPGIEEGSIDIEVCLSLEKLNALGMDVEFMREVAM